MMSHKQQQKLVNKQSLHFSINVEEEEEEEEEAVTDAGLTSRALCRG